MERRANSSLQAMRTEDMPATIVGGGIAISVVALLFLAVTLVPYLRRPRVADSWVSAGRRLARAVKVALGGYSLRIVMESMVDAMLDGVVPSVTKSYVPNVVIFGLHPQDVRRWGAYFDRLAEELRALILVHVQHRAHLRLCGAL